VDAQRGALFTKLSKEIILSAKSGSPDPEANYRLKMAVEKARLNNMPQDNIKRAIARATGGPGEKDIQELRYEGYGPHSLAVVIDAATDNRNRTAGELRFLFLKHGGTLGESGSVGWMFEPVGVLEVDPQGRSEDDVTEAALVEGVIDLEYGEPAEIYTDPAHLAAARVALEAAGLKVSGAFLGVRPRQKIALQGTPLSEALNFLELLDEHEDVQRVFSNLDVSEAALEALAT
jgi:YebC/PmpR family DNA-binding regulatory protein